jgi:dTDP-4-dehydrorhamnose reductase
MNEQSGKSLKVLVTGAGGQLGHELVLLNEPGIGMIGVDRQALDVTDPEQCMEVVSRYRPDMIIHTASATAVDRLEAEEEYAWRVNAEGTLNIARAAEAVGAKLCYVSTDYVFDGLGVKPYSEDEKTEPKTVYGITKLAGERFAREACSKTFIVRTSWVYGRYGTNFVSTMLQLAQTKHELKVVNDQTGSPTYTLDLARLLVSISKTERYGTYHGSNSGSCTWYDFASAIFEETGLTSKITLVPCKTEEFPRPAPRPAYSVLGHESLIHAGFEPMRHWRAALKDYLKS